MRQEKALRLLYPVHDLRRARGSSSNLAIKPPQPQLELVDTDGDRWPRRLHSGSNMSGADRTTFDADLARDAMAAVLAFGNGLEGDVRITCNTAEAVCVARGLAMGTGNCRRIAAPTDITLYRPATSATASTRRPACSSR